MRSSLTPLSPSKQQSHGGSTPWDVETDISSLFSKHSVDEVRQIEQKTRLDIERKKEDLRQMVGERYRDLIDAADSIMKLRTGSEQVGTSLGQLTKVCQSLQQTHFLKGLGGMRGPPPRNETHVITAQMKVLGDAPEKIWHSLEQQQYLEATQLFLVARHTHSLLQISLAKNTLLQRLWHATANFRSTILKCCRHHLQTTHQSTPAVLSSLCSIVLLEGCSLRQVFTQFLLAQKVAIQSVFHPTKQMHYSVKAQISEAVSVIRRSIILIARIFCSTPGQESSLLLVAVKDFTNKQEKGIIPTQRSSITEIPSSDIHSSCLEWLTACGEDVSQEVKPLLCHVTSVKGLNVIRAALHSLLAEPEKAMPTSQQAAVNSRPTPSDREGWSEQWSVWSSLVTGANVCIWQRFLQQLFLDRAETILTKHFSEAEDHANNTLNQLLSGMTSDPSHYAHDINVTSQLWTEDSSRTPARGRERGREVQMGVSTLSLKTKACTPSVYSFCQQVDQKLLVIVEDAAYYLQPTQPVPQTQSKLPISVGEEFPFHLHGDHHRMQAFLQHSTVEFVTRFLTKVNETVNKLHSLLQPPYNELSSSVTDRLLLIARVCQCLSEFCPSLSLLSCGCQTPPSGNITLPLRAHRGRGQRSTRRKEEESESGTVRQLLSSQCSSIHRVWADCSAQQFVSKYREQLLSSTELNTLSSSLVWDDISIVEEGEAGKQVTSVIRVPAQASVYVTSLLFAACQEISRIGGHTIDRNVLQHFSGKCLYGVLEVHQSLLGNLSSAEPGAMHQNCALQLLFNIRFLCGVLCGPKEMEEDTAKLQQLVVDQLHAHIDPFDLDVFTPYILSALEKQLQRSTVLFGLLLALRGSAHQLLSGRKPHLSSTQEKHIVVPLFPSTPRFPSLPISTPTQPTKPPQTHHQCSDDDVHAPRTFLETVTFFHHM